MPISVKPTSPSEIWTYSIRELTKYGNVYFGYPIILDAPFVNIDYYIHKELITTGALEPVTGTETTETQRFSKYFLLPHVLSWNVKSVLVMISLWHTYGASGSTTAYWKLYAQPFVYDFATNTVTLIGTEQGLQVDTTAITPSGAWQDNYLGNIAFLFNVDTDVEGKAVGVRIRGTSWDTGGYATSIGFRGNGGNVVVVKVA